MKREQPLISVTVRSARRLSRLLLIFVSSLSAVAWSQGPQKLQPSNGFQIFSSDLDGVRNLLRIPGMAAAIVEDGRIVWQRDFGLADVENKLPVTASTEFCIASLSKTMAAAILMQLREAGQLRLDDAVVKYLPDSGLAANITIREVMSHTSDGVPGEEFLYNGARYAVLSRVIEKITGKPYASVLSERILQPLSMSQTIPGLDAQGYAPLQRALARPYDWDENSSSGTRAGEWEKPGLSAATGVVSTVDDMVKYAVALDGDKLVSFASKTAMFTPTRSTQGEYLPYGLGWFVQTYLGQRFVWHFGQEDSYASLFLRVPERKLTLIVLANSNAMSDAFRLLDGNAVHSLVALDFIKDVVLGTATAETAAQHQLEYDTEIDRALASLYLDQHDQAVSFMSAAFATGVNQQQSDVTTLYLLMRLRDPRFNPVTVTIGTDLVRQHPHLPPVLFDLGIFYEQAGSSEKAIPLFETIAGIQPPLRHWTTVMALLELGRWYENRDPSRAREYLQRVVALGWNLNGAVDQARLMLNQLPASAPNAGVL
jgi:CubicO group peptidase (beta-lactamase class C family)